MKRFLIWLLVFGATIAQSQTMGGSSGPVIWSGGYGKVLPSSGLSMISPQGIKFSEDPANGTGYVEVIGPSSVVITGKQWQFPYFSSITSPQIVVGDTMTQTLTNKNIDCSSNACSNVDLASDVTGVLPLANGGTNKNMTAANGGLVYSDADSLEVTAAGTSGQWVLSGGAGAPTMSNTTTTGKVVDGSADENQLRVQGNATQTSDILVVEKSDGTDLFKVSNAAATFATAPTVSTFGKGIIESSGAGVFTSTNLWTAGGGTATGSDCTSNPCTIGPNHGGALASIGWTSTGIMTVNFTGSFWSSAPACTVTSNRGGAVYAIINGDVSTSGFTVNCRTGSTDALINCRFQFMCIGPRS